MVTEGDGGQLLSHHTVQNRCGLEDLSGRALEDQEEAQGQGDLTDGKVAHGGLWL